MTVTFEAPEWNQLSADLGKASLRMVRQGHQIITKTVHDGMRDSMAFCPVDTGNLRNSHTANVRGLEGDYGPTADYADYVENGTSVMAPQAFVGPSFDRQNPPFVAAVASIAGVIL